MASPNTFLRLFSKKMTDIVIFFPKIICCNSDSNQFKLYAFFRVLSLYDSSGKLPTLKRTADVLSARNCYTDIIQNLSLN